MKLSLKAKIIGTSVSLVALCIGISSYGSWKLNHSMESFKYIAENNFMNVQNLGKMEKAGVLLEAAANRLIESEVTKETYEDTQKKYEDALAVFAEASKSYESLPFAEGEEEAWKKFNEDFWKGYVADAQKILALSATGKKEDYAARDKFAGTTWAEVLKARRGEFKKLTEFQNNDAKKRTEEADAEEALLKWLIPMMMAVTALLSIVGSFLLGSAIGKSLMRLADQIADSSSQVASASTQIHSSSQVLSNATTEQAASLEETAASLEEITAMISKASDSAGNAAQSSVESHNKAEEGRGAVDQMMNSMTEISQSNEAIMTQINQSNQQMTEIVKVIQEIGNKTKVINDIVFQTKLLSFNASVEARANEWKCGERDFGNARRKYFESGNDRE